MNEQNILLADALRHNDTYDISAVEAMYREALTKLSRKVVVFDDDPTGIQTTHDVYVYTRWDAETLTEALLDPYPMFYVLTNSRALTAKEAGALLREAAENLIKAAKRTGRTFTVMLRGDSTLRGHFPLETETIKNVLAEHGIRVDGEILIPFFPEGGRYTFNDVHYLTQDGKTLIPVGNSEFARDWTFGYRSSNLPEWVEEKSNGRFPKESVASVSVEELSGLRIREIREKLEGLTDFQKLIVNCTSYTDLKVFMTAFIGSLETGRNYLMRTASSATKVLGGVPDRPLLTKEELTGVNDTGVIVIGSHTKRTTDQLWRLRERFPELEYIEFDVTGVLEPEKFRTAWQEAADRLAGTVREGRTAVVYTTREDFTVDTGDPEDELRAAVAISDAVTAFIEELPAQPGFIIAKGGITSSGIGTKALHVRRALALGQILPGVPVWKLGPESRYRGTSFIIFPGNVGTEDALADAAAILKQ